MTLSQQQCSLTYIPDFGCDSPLEEGVGGLDVIMDNVSHMQRVQALGHVQCDVLAPGIVHMMVRPYAVRCSQSIHMLVIGIRVLGLGFDCQAHSRAAAMY